MSETMEELEGVCDDIANAIDDSKGQLSFGQVKDQIGSALSGTPYERDEFDTMFENMYLCDVRQYIANSSDDANWAAENDVDDVDVIEDFDELTAAEASELGIAVLDEPLE